MTLEHNIAMRNTAATIINLAGTEAGADPRFWTIIRDHALKLAPLPPRPPATLEPLSDEDARAFGRRVISFGQYAHQRYDDVPLGYLEWLADQNVQLVRYIRSRRVQGEMVTREDPTEEQDR